MPDLHTTEAQTYRLAVIKNNNHNFQLNYINLR